MAKHLDVPPDLEHLIEKREISERRQAPRREKAADANQKRELTATERRQIQERRKKNRR